MFVYQETFGFLSSTYLLGESGDFIWEEVVCLW